LAHTLHASPEHLAQMLACIDTRAGDLDAPAWGLVTAGSLPPGLPPDAHAQILARAHAHGLITLLDGSGPGLVAGVRALPHILKVNQAEFSALVATLGREGEAENGLHADAPAAPNFFSFKEPLSAPSGSYEQTLRLAEQVESYLGRLAREAIVITLGPGGILAVTHQGIYHAPALPVQVVSPAGAGDAVSAGIMLARSRGEDWSAALIWAAALAAAVVSNPGTAECSREQVLTLAEQATVIELDAVER
jgi:fructose-1-phosphate kinase PfkB-like protein